MLEAMVYIANCGRSKRNKGLKAITVITGTTAVVRSGKVRQQEQQ